MIERTIGSSPLSVGVVGLGCNNFSRPGTVTETLEGSIRVIHAAIDSGITFLDGADIYGGVPGRSEEYIGAALTDGRRDQVVLSTKFGHRSLPMPGTEDWGPKGARTYLRNAVEASLTRLRTDRIDLLQMHTPDDSTDCSPATQGSEARKRRSSGSDSMTAACSFSAICMASTALQPGSTATNSSPPRRASVSVSRIRCTMR